MNGEKQERKNDGEVKKFLRTKTGVFYGRIAFLTVLSLITAGLSLAFSYSAKFIVNSVGDEKKVIFCVAVSLSLLLTRIISGAFQSYFSGKTRAQIVKKLRADLFESFVKADALSSEKYHSGEIINRFTSDINEVAADVVYIVPTAASVVLRLLGTLALLFVVDVWFALIFLGGSLLTAGIVALYRKKIKEYRKETLLSDGKTRSFVQESVAALVTIKLYGAEEKMSKTEKSFDEEYYRAVMKRTVFSSATNGVYSLIGNAGLIFAIVYFAVGGILSSTADFGSALSVILLLIGVQQPVNTLSAVISAFYTLAVSASRLKEIDDLYKKPAYKRVICDFEEIKAENASFSYGDGEVIKNACFNIRKGEKVCIFGDSGQGKSTFFKLLTGVYPPENGSVTVKSDGENYSADEVTGLFAYVPQGNFLFSGTVYDNLVCFADGKISDEKIKSALAVAEASFVYSLKDGLSTILGERGCGLSEGQIQRLAIARAIVSDKPVILFDEATSSLDEKTEENVLKNVIALKDKTCIFISHRQKALKLADRAVKLENGAFIDL